mmetsp:Transcript_19104/g.25920  ORF Transcript_19104/g.25920 Transcript_19104/m.25920 type:complete len:80 (-) Transcript_19104:37-276(-)
MSTYVKQVPSSGVNYSGEYVDSRKKHRKPPTCLRSSNWQNYKVQPPVEQMDISSANDQCGGPWKMLFVNSFSSKDNTQP